MNDIEELLRALSKDSFEVVDLIDGRAEISEAVGDQILQRLGRGSELFRYFSEYFPSRSFGAPVRIYGIEELREECSEMYPGCEITKQGLIGVAKDVDGSQYCCSVVDGRVFHVEYAGGNFDDTIRNASESWPSLTGFLQFLLESGNCGS